jgi:hypothetical protein
MCLGERCGGSYLTETAGIEYSGDQPHDGLGPQDDRQIPSGAEQSPVYARGPGAEQVGAVQGVSKGEA